MKKRIAVLMGGMSSEREISFKTGAAVLGALQRRGYDAVGIDADPGIAERLRAEGAAAAFIALHGAFGEDGTVQGLLEMLRIPYTGSGVLASALSINKIATKKMLMYHGLPTPDFQAVRAAGGNADTLVRAITMAPPFVVKPPEEGSTIGITIVDDAVKTAGAVALALGFSPEVLVERFVRGRELTAAVLDGEALPLVEIIPEGGFYDYDAKYHSDERKCEKTRYVVAPDIGAGLTRRMQELAVTTYGVLGCDGAARVDFLLDGDTPYILEINTIPGMTETSLLPKAAASLGIDFDSLVERILWGARVRKISSRA